MVKTLIMMMLVVVATGVALGSGPSGFAPSASAEVLNSDCAVAAASGGKDILALWKCVYEITTALWKNGNWYGDFGGY